MSGCPSLEVAKKPEIGGPWCRSLSPSFSKGETEVQRGTVSAQSHNEPGPEPRSPDSHSDLVATQSASIPSCGGVGGHERSFATAQPPQLGSPP